MTEKKPDKKDFDELEPFIGESSTAISIKGKEYRLRRLNITDIFKIGRILGIGAAGMGKEIGKMDLNPGVLAGLLLVSFPYAEKQCLEFIASVINVKIDDLRNPEIFPVDSILDIFKILIEQEDVKAFFDKLVGLLKTPIFKELSKKD